MEILYIPLFHIMGVNTMEFDIIVGDYFKFDFFLTDEGNLGFTVSNINDPEHSVDIFVQKDLKVIS